MYKSKKLHMYTYRMSPKNMHKESKVHRAKLAKGTFSYCDSKMSSFMAFHPENNIISRRARKKNLNPPYGFYIHYVLFFGYPVYINNVISFMMIYTYLLFIFNNNDIIQN